MFYTKEIELKDLTATGLSVNQRTILMSEDRFLDEHEVISCKTKNGNRAIVVSYDTLIAIRNKLLNPATILQLVNFTAWRGYDAYTNTI